MSIAHAVEVFSKYGGALRVRHLAQHHDFLGVPSGLGRMPRSAARAAFRFGSVCQFFCGAAASHLEPPATRLIRSWGIGFARSHRDLRLLCLVLPAAGVRNFRAMKHTAIARCPAHHLSDCNGL